MSNATTSVLNPSSLRDLDPEIHALVAAELRDGVGGRADRADGFEGRLDEVAIFDRALSAAEISAQFRASGR